MCFCFLFVFGGAGGCSNEQTTRPFLFCSVFVVVFLLFFVCLFFCFLLLLLLLFLFCFFVLFCLSCALILFPKTSYQLIFFIYDDSNNNSGHIYSTVSHRQSVVHALQDQQKCKDLKKKYNKS